MTDVDFRMLFSTARSYWRPYLDLFWEEVLNMTGRHPSVEENQALFPESWSQDFTELRYGFVSKLKNAYGTFGLKVYILEHRSDDQGASVHFEIYDHITDLTWHWYEDLRAHVPPSEYVKEDFAEHLCYWGFPQLNAVMLMGGGALFHGETPEVTESEWNAIYPSFRKLSDTYPMSPHDY